ncbi:Clp protease N-terminal domain-containing protein [Streptomyces phaeochromogenes]|uniref:Clp protease N-terminal domain-containing protein n=1 Tax=Streptomyces phaeochromogenes TaxID=1923 RepID=UPI0033CD842B
MSEDAVRALAKSATEARSLGHSTVSATHVLLSIAHHDGPARHLLDTAGADYETVRTALAAGGHATKVSRTRDLPWSPAMEKILHLSQSFTKKPFTPAHLLALILDHDERTTAMLKDLGVNTAELRAAVATAIREP